MDSEAGTHSSSFQLLDQDHQEPFSEDHEVFLNLQSADSFEITTDIAEYADRGVVLSEKPSRKDADRGVVLSEKPSRKDADRGVVLSEKPFGHRGRASVIYFLNRIEKHPTSHVEEKTLKPWMVGYYPEFIGFIADGYNNPLYVCSSVETPSYSALKIIEEFCMVRFFRGKFTYPRSPDPPNPLHELQAWNVFLNNLINGRFSPAAAIKKDRVAFYQNYFAGQSMLIHSVSRIEGIPCAVINGCPLCLPNSPKLPIANRYLDMDGITLTPRFREYLLDYDRRFKISYNPSNQIKQAAIVTVPKETSLVHDPCICRRTLDWLDDERIARLKLQMVVSELREQCNEALSRCTTLELDNAIARKAHKDHIDQYQALVTELNCQNIASGIKRAYDPSAFSYACAAHRKKIYVNNRPFKGKGCSRSRLRDSEGESTEEMSEDEKNAVHIY